MPDMTAEETAALNRVRRRVGALAFFSVAVHGVLGLIGAAHVLQSQAGRGDDAVGLVAMSGVVALLTYAGVRGILGARMWSPAWILVSLAPTVAAAIWIV